jgi:hypothetical protein
MFTMVPKKAKNRIKIGVEGWGSEGREIGFAVSNPSIMLIYPGERKKSS